MYLNAEIFPLPKNVALELFKDDINRRWPLKKKYRAIEGSISEFFQKMELNETTDNIKEPNQTANFISSKIWRPINSRTSYRAWSRFLKNQNSTKENTTLKPFGDGSERKEPSIRKQRTHRFVSEHLQKIDLDKETSKKQTQKHDVSYDTSVRDSKQTKAIQEKSNKHFKIYNQYAKPRPIQRSTLRQGSAA